MSVTSGKSSPPPPFKITDLTQLEDWKKWQRSFRYYANAINLEQESHDVQLSTFKSLVGPDALEIYNTFSILDITDVESVIRKFDDHFKPKVNVTLERYKLYKLNQKSGQKFEDFLADVTNQVNKCEFSSLRDDIVLYKIVGGIENEDIRNSLLAEADLKYDKAVQICQSSSILRVKSGKENVCRKVTVEKKEQCRSAKVSHKQVRSSLLGRIEKDEKIDSVQMRPSRDQKQNEASKVLDPGSIMKKSLKQDKVQRRSTNRVKAEPATEKCLKKRSENSSILSDLEENDGTSMEDQDSDGGCSDWRADDDNDDDYHPETYVKFVMKRQHSKKKRQKNSNPKGTREIGERFTCSICKRAVGSKRDLERHIATHAQVGKVTCHHCGGRYKQKRYLLRHIVRSHPGIINSVMPKIFICDVCGYKTNQRANMRRHNYQHTEERPFSCELCEYKCIVPRLMNAHMAKHTGERPHVCSVCQKGFIESNALKKHMIKHMSPEEREKHLTKEKESSRSLESSATCETCGKVFSSRGALKTHSVVHTGERPFACTICDYRAGQKSALNAHLAKHSDEKPFVCTVCGYACKLKRVLQTHMHTHTGDRPYACKLCDSKFKQLAHLTVHLRTHTGEKPYVCDICGHRWAKQSNLTQHMKIHQNPTGDPSQYTPPRKRKKKRKTDAPTNDPAPTPAPANAIPQWSEQVSTINPMECFLNLETPPPFHLTYPPQANTRPPDCRYFQQRQCQDQNQAQNLNEHLINTKGVPFVGTEAHGTHSSR